MTASSTLRLGIAQICAHPEPENNLPILEECLRKMAAQQADLAVFPEYCLSLGSFRTMRKIAQPIEQWRKILGQLCRQQGLAAIFSGMPVKENNYFVNSSLALSASGKFLDRYDKRHLFSLKQGKKQLVDESSFFTPGYAVPTVFRFQGWKIALTTCFDLRFPTFWQKAEPHPDLYLCPSAFTHATGKDHWLPLLQARAIENLSWVAGVGQCGCNPETGLELHGHSVVFDPWGKQAAALLHREPGLLCLELDKQILLDSRQRLPACPFAAADIPPRFPAAYQQ
jgi:predicted amidohydrolase